jgi:hypothetical protein
MPVDILPSLLAKQGCLVPTAQNGARQKRPILMENTEIGLKLMKKPKGFKSSISIKRGKEKYHGSRLHTGWMHKGIRISSICQQQPGGFQAFGLKFCEYKGFSVDDQLWIGACL